MPTHPINEHAPAIRTSQVNVAPDMIDLGIGQPGFDLLPQSELRLAAAQRLAQEDVTLLSYGFEQGDGYFRQALAGFLSEEYGCDVASDELFVTAGASQALDLICTLLTQPGDTIFVEEPSYFLALRIFADHGLNVVGLPTDEHGLVVEALEEQLTTLRPRFVYVIPTFQNPASTVLTEARRQRLVELSVEHDFFVVADEVYHALHYTETPPAPLAAYGGEGTVLSLGSFSKILAPGLRLGWIHAAPQQLERFVLCGLVDSGGSLNHFTANIVRSALEMGLQQSYLAGLRAIYRSRIATLDGALRAHLPGDVTFRTPGGGYFFWLQLPGGVDTDALLPQAHAHNVGYQPGVRFSSTGGLTDCLRLSFAFYNEEQLCEGAERLAHVIKGAL